MNLSIHSLVYSQRLDPSNFEEFYGVSHDLGRQSETSYILFYESRDA